MKVHLEYFDGSSSDYRCLRINYSPNSLVLDLKEGDLLEIEFTAVHSYSIRLDKKELSMIEKFDNSLLKSSTQVGE